MRRQTDVCSDEARPPSISYHFWRVCHTRVSCEKKKNETHPKEKNCRGRVVAIDLFEVMDGGACSSGCHPTKVKSKPGLTTLPVEITFRIWELVNPDTLLQVGSVCRRWQQLSRDSFFWRAIVEEHQKAWKSFTGERPTPGKKGKRSGLGRLLSHHHSSKSSVSDPIGGARTDWRRCFAEQILAQHRFQHQRQIPNIFSSRPHRNGRVYRIPIIGSGLGSSAKTFLYPLLCDKSSPLQRTELYPGTLGIGSGVGFRFGVKEVNCCALYYFQRQLLESWRSFLSKSQACIFVINPRACEENLARARGLLHSLMYDGHQKPVLHGPLLVVGMPPLEEKPSARALPPMSALELVKELQIERLPCTGYHVVLNHELHQGNWTTTLFALRWLVDMM